MAQAAVLDIATIRAQRAAAAAAAPDLVVLLAQQIVDQMIVDKAVGKKRSANECIEMMCDFSILNRRHNP
jgi:hypothetical protein